MESFSPQGWSAEDVADPYPIYRRYRAADPVHQAAPGSWYVFDYAIAGDLLRPLTARRELDLVREFAAPLPVLVISALLGVPASRHGWFRERTERLQEASSAA